MGGTPSRTGYTFTGWAGVPARMPNNAATYNAGWSINSYNLSGGWYTLQGGVAGAWTSSNGSPPWIRNGSAFPQFAINSTAVPEPGVLSVFVLGGFLLVWQRQKPKAI